MPASPLVTASLRIVLGLRLEFCNPNRDMVEKMGSMHAVDEAVAIALFREKVIQELEVVAVPVPVRARHQMRLCPPPIG